MSSGAPFPRCWLFVLAGVLGAATLATAQVPELQPPLDPIPAVTSELPAATPSDPDALYQKALLLERSRDWAGAIEIYQDALETWPGRSEFRHRLRLCETHFKLGRRYQDRSFRETLLVLPRDRALELYDELVERIQANNVESVGIEPLMRHGFDNLEVALRDPVFIEVHARNAGPDAVRRLRDALLSYRQKFTARDRQSARAVLVGVCEQARSLAGIPSTPVILEFCYGAFEALDEYSTFLSPDRLEDLYAMIDGNFVGLGVELKLDPEGLLLVNVLKGGPASEAGLQPGDRIIQVDQRVLKGLDLDVSANLLQGPEGSRVRIGVLRADGSRVTHDLTRRPVDVQSVAEARVVDESTGVGYIQLIGFQKTSTTELQTAIARLERQGMRSLVLDLRGNPGGLLNVAVEIADRFLERGVIVTTRGRATGQTMDFRASGRPLWRMPVIVLVDHDSASASEILAGALQDNHRATVLGEQSYGKGSVQSIFPLRSVPAGLKLTTAKFYSPGNRSYSEQGVLPDMVVRSAARPAEGDAAIRQLSAIGDPSQDPVLRAAIEQITRLTVRRAG